MMEGVDNERRALRQVVATILDLIVDHLALSVTSSIRGWTPLDERQPRPSCPIPWVIAFHLTLLHHLFICFSSFEPDSRFRLLLSLSRILKFRSLFDGEPDERTIPLTSSKFTGALHLAVQSMNAIQSTARRLPGLQGGLRFSKTLVNYPDENPEPTGFGVEVV